MQSMAFLLLETGTGVSNNYVRVIFDIETEVIDHFHILQ